MNYYLFFIIYVLKKVTFFDNKNYKEKIQKLSIKELIVLNLNFIFLFTETHFLQTEITDTLTEKQKHLER